MRVYNEKGHLVKIVCNSCAMEYRLKNQVIKRDFLSVSKSWGYFSNKDGMRQEFDLCESCFERLNRTWMIPASETEETEYFGALEDSI